MKNNKLLTVVFIVFCIIFLMKQCGKTNSQTNVSQNNEQSLFGKKEQTIPADEVHKFENYKSPKGVLDDDGIYRYKFLDEDDSVYDAMSYQEVDEILPVFEQRKINVTLGTNFSLYSNHFNLPTNWEAIYKTIYNKKPESENKFELANGESRLLTHYLPNFKNEEFSFLALRSNGINTKKRKIKLPDADLTTISVEYKKHSGFANEYKMKENGKAPFSYEGINIGITRKQFLENVTINNPVYEDQYFNYNKEFDKNSKGYSITYFLDERGEDDSSYAEFKFENEILTEIRIVCTKEYLKLKVQ
ncbi:hypothetical protein [Streptococcus ovis]|uniref:hypothetical protein n=1 Tax=Streptococcus ovis TaxID=82806 RepID=UPI000363419A|nr:hypothetical protein [Streptococcus ovis]